MTLTPRGGFDGCFLYPLPIPFTALIHINENVSGVDLPNLGQRVNRGRWT